MESAKQVLLHSLGETYSVYARDCAVVDDALGKSLLRKAAVEIERILKRDFGVGENDFNNLFAQESCLAVLVTGKLVLRRDDDYAIAV